MLALLATISVAATSAVARESHSGSSKSRSAKHAKAGRSKATAAKHKSTSKKAETAHRKADRLRDTGDIDVSAGNIGQDLPPEELPVSDADDAADTDDEPALLPTP